MSIASELLALQTHITNAYGAVNDKGGTIPANKNMANLATAIASISGGGGTLEGFNILSGKITPSSSVQELTIMSYADFISEVGGTLPTTIFAGIFCESIRNRTTGFAYMFGVYRDSTSPHYRNNASYATRGSLDSSIIINNTKGVYFRTYSIANAYFMQNVEYTWFILYKN